MGGPGGARQANAFFYPPSAPGWHGAAGERPPLVVMGHGGPTSAARPQLNLGVQFWTSRGFGVVDVNYGGSTGFGRAYRQLLNGTWGIVDVEDSVAVATELARAGEVDPDRLAIRAESAHPAEHALAAAPAARATLARHHEEHRVDLAGCARRGQGVS
jgi:hypothetical protein